MKRWLALALGAICFCGCDRAPTAPAALKAQQDQQAQAEPGASDHPTTQELLTGPYVKLPLPDMPLSLRVPVSWKFNNAATLVLLEGPAPSGHEVIQLAVRKDPQRSDQVPADRFEGMMARLKKETDDQPGPIKKFDLRDMSGLKVLERMDCSNPITTPKQDYRGNTVVDSQGNAVMETITPLHWTVSVFQLDGGVYNRYELNVIGLTTEQYAIDKELLEKILGSLAYEALPGTTAAPNPQQNNPR